MVRIIIKYKINIIYKHLSTLVIYSNMNNEASILSS